MSDQDDSPVMLPIVFWNESANSIPDGFKGYRRVPIEVRCPHCRALNPDVLYQRRKLLKRRVRKIGVEAVEKEIRDQFPRRLRSVFRGWSFRDILGADYWELVRAGATRGSDYKTLENILNTYGLRTHMNPRAVEHVFKPPTPRSTPVCGICGKPGHNAKRHREGTKPYGRAASRALRPKEIIEVTARGERIP